MALSPNYGWAEPDNSSLVKNGAADIRTLGDSIDTSVWNIGFGQAGKNKLINGDFAINQRSFTSTTSAAYGFDRWALDRNGGTVTYSAQTFTTGAAPVAGYEAQNFARVVTASQSGTNNYAQLYQLIEDVRNFAGQTITVSFWAKAATGTPKIAVELGQNFGSGGSPSASVQTYAGQATLSTSWARYSLTVAIPSISGKTIGTTANTSSLGVTLWISGGSDFNSRTGSLGLQNNTFDTWGIQAEYGSKATPFETATGTIQGELAACQRYYIRATADAGFRVFGTGQCFGTTTGAFAFKYPVTMRTRPTALEQSGTASHYAVLNAFGSATTCSAVPNYDGATTNEFGWAGFTVASGLTAGNATVMLSNNTSAAYFGWSAEL
jgi:hypothetical protein